MSDVSIEDVDARDLPPSCKFVYKEVLRHGEIRRQKLLEETTLPERTLYDALERLENRQFITVARDPDDLRRVVVTPAGL